MADRIHVKLRRLELEGVGKRAVAGVIGLVVVKYVTWFLAVLLFAILWR